MNHLSSVVAIEPIGAVEVDADLVDEVLDDDFGLFVRVLRLAAASVRPGKADSSVAQGVLTGARDREAGAEAAHLPGGPGGHLDAARRLLVLRGAPLFRTTPVDGLAAFAKRLELVRIPAGETFELAGPSGALAMIVAGRAAVATAEGSPTPSTAAAGPGDVLGALESLVASSQPLLGHARSELHLLRGVASDLLDVIEDHHVMRRRLMAEILGLTLAP